MGVEVLEVFNSLAEACDQCGCTPSAVSQVTTKKPRLDKRDGRYYTSKTACGYKWEYVK